MPNTILASLEDVDTCVATVAPRLLCNDYFCLWLNGDIGVGKTYWVNRFLHHLGLTDDVVVNSPTYIHAREYRIAADIYNHADLYRLANTAEFLALNIDHSRYRGEIYEWASPANCCVAPTHRLNIEFNDSPDKRKYVFI
ncbi:MAG: tRNA (adenosine(37)-N6)-threonylcarbamoyltransferase complex ATPase subunit type 1 TsaE [Pseudomonadota bacterium]|nr:tRNA (adenosine(37)-N6)-threonylcarbamoyltransferase complex ATPase subunit type 1 TsaE [Pseudomonadota bacterium]